MTVAQAIQHPTAAVIILAEITAGLWLRNWVLADGAAITYKIATDLEVYDVQFNGESLAEATSVVDVEANPGSWYSDGSYVYASAPDGASLFGGAVQAFVRFYFANRAKVLNNRFYDPRLDASPALSMRIEAVFGSVGQVGTGDMAFLNQDGFFTNLQDLQWDAGTVTLKVGIDLPKRTMDFADYQTVATWLVETWHRDATRFHLQLIEPKARLKTAIPFNFYSRDDYPNIDDSNIGRVIQIAYGRVLGANPVSIDPGAKRFKVAGHAISSFDGVRIKQSREENRTQTVAGANWQTYTAAVFRYYLAGEEATNVTFNGVSMTKKNSVADCQATDGTWTQDSNYVYVNPNTGQTINSGTYQIASRKTVEAFQTTDFASVDPDNGEFNLGEDWASGMDVSVDFTGKVDGDGVAILNAADIIQDLLATIGETNLNADSFTESHNRLDLGYNEDGRITIRRPALYLDEAGEVLDIIGNICAAVGGFLFSDQNGRYAFGIFEPQPGENLTAFDDVDILDFDDKSDLSGDSGADIFSKVVLSYAKRAQDAFAEVATEEKTATQYLHALPAPAVNVANTILTEDRDATELAQRILLMQGAPLKQYTITTKWQGLLKQPGDQVRLNSAARNVDEVLEVLEVNCDLSAKTVKLTLGNLRNYRDTPGFWTDDPGALPTRFSNLAGYGTGSLVWNKNWHPDIKAWARQNVGYWTDDNGFADPTDPDSFITSTWI